MSGRHKCFHMVLPAETFSPLASNAPALHDQDHSIFGYLDYVPIPMSQMGLKPLSWYSRHRIFFISKTGSGEISSMTTMHAPFRTVSTTSLEPSSISVGWDGGTTGIVVVPPRFYFCSQANIDTVPVWHIESPHKTGKASSRLNLTPSAHLRQSRIESLHGHDMSRPQGAIFHP